MVSWVPRLPPAVSGSGARCGRVCWARVSPVLSPSWLGCRGVFFFFFALRFFLFFFFLFFFFFLGFVVPVPPSPFFRAGLVALFFFFFFPCPFLPWSAVTGLVLPVSGGWFPCASAGVPLFFFFFFFPGGGAWPPVVVLAAGWAAVGCFRAFSPSPLLFFFFFSGGGLACSSLCLPWAGARTGLYSVFSSGLLSSVAFCVAMFRPHGSGGLCTRWARRPFLLGQVLALPVGRLRQAAACGFGLGAGVARGLTPLRCGLYSSGWSVTVVAWRAVAPCVACGAGVWRGGAAPSRVCGGWLRLVPQVRVSCVVLCRSVPRRVASCCGALLCGALWCGVPWSRVVPRWVSGGQPGLCGSVRSSGNSAE